MAKTMSKLDTAPGWINQLVHEIDSLEFGHAFEQFAPESELSFGSHRSRGPEEIREYFRKMHIGMDTRHEIHEVWSGSAQTYVLGEVNMITKTESHENSFEPFQWMLYEDESGSGRLRRWLVTAGPA